MAEERVLKEWEHKASWDTQGWNWYIVYSVQQNKSQSQPKFLGEGNQPQLQMEESEKIHCKDHGDREEQKILANFVIYHKNN